jgi:tRNA A37 threonylcarbamoyladenosine biosynthesis protein TsaE
MDLYRLSDRDSSNTLSNSNDNDLDTRERIRHESQFLPLNLDAILVHDICLLEWPQRLLGTRFIPEIRLELQLRISTQREEGNDMDENDKLEYDDDIRPRYVTIIPYGRRWEERLEWLVSEGYVDDWIV